MRSLRFCALIVLVLATSLCASGQTLPPTTADDQMGFQPFNSFHGGDIDHIGLVNGTVTLDYPFLSYSQRGKLHLDFHLYYTDQPEHIAQDCVPNLPMDRNASISGIGFRINRHCRWRKETCSSAGRSKWASLLPIPL